MEERKENNFYSRIKNKSYKKKDFFKTIKLFILIIYLIILFSLIQLILSTNKDRTILYKYSFITLKVKSTGNVNIFHSNKNSNYHDHPHAPEPDEIYINDVKQNEIKSSYNFDKEDNKVKLIWGNEIITTAYLFLHCSKITEINLSNFNSSNVEIMSSMFNNCSSLTLLNLSNFNTSKVIYMNHLFMHCSSLTY